MIEYTLDDDDYVAFQDHFFDTSPTMRKALKRNLVVVTGFYLAIGAFFFAIDNVAAAIGFGLVGVLWLPLYPKYARRRLRKRALALRRDGDDSYFRGPHQLNVEGGDLTCVSPSGTSRLKACAIRRIDSTDTHLFLYVSATNALIVPRAKLRLGDATVFERELRAAVQGVA